MVSLRLITTGLDDVHSVIGYNIADSSGSIQSILIQPKEGCAFSYEAMHDVNGISIPELMQHGENRRESLQYLMDDIDDSKILVWYKPFIVKFLLMVTSEIGYHLEPDTEIIDLYTLAKQKGLEAPTFKLADVYEYTGCTDMFQLYDYLKAMPEPQRIRRV